MLDWPPTRRPAIMAELLLLGDKIAGEYRRVKCEIGAARFHVSLSCGVCFEKIFE